MYPGNPVLYTTVHYCTYLHDIYPLDLHIKKKYVYNAIITDTSTNINEQLQYLYHAMIVIWISSFGFLIITYVMYLLPIGNI